MTTALPPGVGIGTITGWMEFAVKDSDDPDPYPDAEVATGTITFQPSVRLLRGPGVLILPTPIPVALDSDGKFLVQLVATNDSNVVPHFEPTASWFYTVIFAVPGVSISPIQIAVLEGVTQDIVELI